MTESADLRDWPAEDLLILARAAGMLWDSTGRDDPYEVLNDRQRQLLDRAAASYLVAEQGGLDAAEYMRLSRLPAEIGTTFNCVIKQDAQGFYARCINCPYISRHADTEAGAREFATAHDEDRPDDGRES